MVRRLPLLAWVPGYPRRRLRGDVVAGVTVTAYLLPQVMAYADVAGMPAVAGIWSAVGALLAYAALASALCWLVAGLSVIGWFGGLAFLADLLSRPVLVGYMAGVAGIMIASQL